MKGHREKEFFHCRVLQTPEPHSRGKVDKKIEIFLYAIQTKLRKNEKLKQKINLFSYQKQCRLQRQRNNF